jgi:hypothetical protein
MDCKVLLILLLPYYFTGRELPAGMDHGWALEQLFVVSSRIAAIKELE